ncbi:hypothetical protein PMAYCL1PPCAC_09772, partial [Pristionchus mayeri]
SVLAPIFFVLLILSPVVSSDDNCVWQGTAPWCAPDDCSEGWTEIIRRGWWDYWTSDSIFPEFGKPCWGKGQKVLCCKNSVVRKD